ncbi:MAG: F0F1 ATP synthase subunit A [Clostridia bacterium]|nr:F0F1 ATP synthase subunit A [Clostridia bacterium]
MDISVTGPKVYVRIEWLYQKFAGTMVDMFGNLGNLVTQTTVSIFLVTIMLMILGWVASRNLTKRPGRLQVITEKLITMLYGLVEGTMGKHNSHFTPYIGTLFLTSIFGSLIGTTAIFRSTTADLSVTLAWALVTSGMVWYNNIKNFGFVAWLKGFTEPVVVMTPMNIVGEIAQPLSMAFRHFGNVAGGSVLTTLIYAALAVASKALFSWLPAMVLELFPPLLQAGIPAFLSLYFDFFSAFVQAFVFCLLTMVYVAGACPSPEELAEAKSEE